ncbi:DUF2147 domain-containing protein, partial [Candidatus Skiveiella danica]|uniref:DUF2147 domain-containing protein n=1 Tax=Candidatus Skiveiella danica TaxID=3386177 RepID=UPI0039B8B793
MDDETKQAKALIRIVEQGGALIGRIEKVLTDKADAVCDLCPDDRKGKPVQGMTILTGLKKDGDEWTGGEILDPNNGKLYRAKAKLADGVMGAQIAAHLVNAQVDVLLYDLPAKDGDKSAIARRAIEGLKKLNPAPLGHADLAAFVVPANYEDDLAKLGECDLVI